jgi:YidC/Oxa1 family membrane protein insertase
MRESPMYRQQKMLLYMLPLVFLFSGFYFSLGVMTYWLVSNLWTMGQQFIVIRNMPTPGSDAAIARDARMAKRSERRGIVLIEDDSEEKPEEENRQREQPVSKDRAKKKKKKRK